MFRMFRPKPRFYPGVLARLKDGEYFLIRRRRYIRPDKEEKRQWVYDGTIVGADKAGNIGFVTNLTCCRERNIERLVAW